jgi:hypothetical protein
VLIDSGSWAAFVSKSEVGKGEDLQTFERHFGQQQKQKT